MTKDEVICKSVASLRAKGVTAIKIELEATLNRSYRGRSNCAHCDEGRQECGSCEGTGVYGVDSEDNDIECDYCEEGYRDCDECDGDWEGNADGYIGDDRSCLQFILDHLAHATGETANGEAMTEYAGGHDCALVNQPFPWLHYAMFYNDGSVDSETTLTVPISGMSLEQAVENFKKLPLLPEAFKALAEEIGNGMEVSGAGMHTALLFSEDYSYPTRGYALGHELANFRNSMNQLLPALYFLGTSNETSRGLTYRRPTIGIDTHRAAIDYRGGALEFRVFDTCYDKPEAVIDNVVVIANCMRYWSNTYRDPNIHKITRELRFGTDNGRDLERFYQSATHIDVLNAGLERIKPAYYTITELKQQRGFKLNKRKFNGIEKEQASKARAAYQEYVNRHQWVVMARSSEWRASLLNDAINYRADGMTDEHLSEIERDVEERKQRFEAERQTVDQYIKDRIAQWKSETEGQYRLAFVREES
jgi:hypothetical protein